MQFQRLSIQNFLSIGEANLDLLQGGVTLIAGPNGAGKSSLVSESILWCLYGTTARGVDGDEVINQEAKGECLVTVQFQTDDGVPISITRGRSPNLLRLVINGQDQTAGTMKDTQVLINGIMGLGAQSFINSILCAQGKVAGILNMTDKEAKEVLDDILDTVRFTKAQERARTRLKQVEQSAQQEQDEILACKRTQDACKAQILSIEQALSTWDEEQQRTIEGINERLAQVKAGLIKEADSIIALEKEMELYAGYTPLLEEYRKVRGVGDTNFRNAEESANRLERLNEQIQKKRDNLRKGTITKVCPTCGQEIKGKEAQMHMDLERAKAKDEIAELEKEAQYLEQKLEAYVPQLEALDEKLGGLTESDLIDKCQEYEVRRRQVQQLNANIKVREDHEARLREDLHRTKQGQGAMDALRNRLGDQRKELEEAKEAEVQHHSMWGTYSEEASILKFWVDAFGPAGIRSRILDSVLPFLNERLAFYSNKLTGGSIQIRFETQDTTKGGKVKDSFHIEVYNMNGGDTYEKQSGGEKKRVGLCVVMALHDLVRNRYGKSFNIAVYDEIFDELDEDGVENAVALINELGKEKSIYVISHNPTVKSSIDNHIEVRKQGRTTNIN